MNIIFEPSLLPILIPLGPKYSSQGLVFNYNLIILSKSKVVKFRGPDPISQRRSSSCVSVEVVYTNSSTPDTAINSIKRESEESLQGFRWSSK